MTGARIIALNENSYFQLLSVLKTSTNAEWIKLITIYTFRPQAECITGITNYRTVVAESQHLFTLRRGLCPPDSRYPEFQSALDLVIITSSQNKKAQIE